jgi:hypothetical protein
MMQFTRAFAIALIASIVGLQNADAQNLRKNSVPAEFPPSSYSATQYVDSRGCVFVRAGVNGGTNWVPRVTRDRKLVCGFQPSLSAEQRQSTSAPTEVVQITLDPTPAPEPMPKPVIVSQPKPKPAPVRVASVRQTKPAPVVMTAPKPAVVTQPRTVAVKPHQPMADEAPKVATALFGKKKPERMFNAKPRRGDIVVEGQVPGNVRVVPRHVYENRANALVKPPKGYRTVWKDDRLNPHRAEQTFNGKAKMDAIWTQTVPRRLIIKPAG